MAIKFTHNSSLPRAMMKIDNGNLFVQDSGKSAVSFSVLQVYPQLTISKVPPCLANSSE
jgi:hypothetical protein